MNAPHPSQPLDEADLAIIEAHPFTSELERRLVLEIRRLRASRDEDTAITALEDCQGEAVAALKALSKADYYIEDHTAEQVFNALETVRTHLTRIMWR